MRALAYLLLSAFALAAQVESLSCLEDAGLPAEGHFDLALTGESTAP